MEASPGPNRSEQIQTLEKLTKTSNLWEKLIVDSNCPKFSESGRTHPNVSRYVRMHTNNPNRSKQVRASPKTAKKSRKLSKNCEIRLKTFAKMFAEPCFFVWLEWARVRYRKTSGVRQNRQNCEHDCATWAWNSEGPQATNARQRRLRVRVRLRARVRWRVRLRLRVRTFVGREIFLSKIVRPKSVHPKIVRPKFVRSNLFSTDTFFVPNFFVRKCAVQNLFSRKIGGGKIFCRNSFSRKFLVRTKTLSVGILVKPRFGKRGARTTPSLSSSLVSSSSSKNPRKISENSSKNRREIVEKLCIRNAHCWFKRTVSSECSTETSCPTHANPCQRRISTQRQLEEHFLVSRFRQRRTSNVHFCSDLLSDGAETSATRVSKDLQNSVFSNKNDQNFSSLLFRTKIYSFSQFSVDLEVLDHFWHQNRFPWASSLRIDLFTILRPLERLVRQWERWAVPGRMVDRLSDDNS